MQTTQINRWPLLRWTLLRAGRALWTLGLLQVFVASQAFRAVPQEIAPIHWIILLCGACLSVPFLRPPLGFIPPRFDVMGFRFFLHGFFAFGAVMALLFFVIAPLTEEILWLKPAATYITFLVSHVAFAPLSGACVLGYTASSLWLGLQDLGLFVLPKRHRASLVMMFFLAALVWGVWFVPTLMQVLNF